MSIHEYTQQVAGFLRRIDTFVNTFSARGVVVVKESVLTGLGANDPITFVPIRSTLCPSPCAEIKGAGQILRDICKGPYEEGDFFVIWEDSLVKGISNNKAVLSGRCDPGVLLWTQAVTRVWLRVSNLQILVASKANFFYQDQYNLLLSEDELWDQFSKFCSLVSRDDFGKECEKLSDVSHLEGFGVDEIKLRFLGQCYLISSLALYCGGEQESLDFLRGCRNLAFKKIQSP